MVAGRELTPKNAADARRLHDYWTAGPGLAKWAGSDHPWTELRAHLLQYLSPDEATRTATVWYHDVFHVYPNSAAAKAMHG